MTKMPQTKEQRLEKDRLYHRKKYEENKERMRAENLARYYKRKEEDPTYKCLPVGRPRKDVEQKVSENNS